MIRSLVKRGIWGSGLDTLLTRLQRIIDDHGHSGFPVTELEHAMTALGKSPAFDPTEIDELLEMRYGGPRTFSVLSLLHPGLDFTKEFHEDHIFPRSRFTAKRLVDAVSHKIRSRSTGLSLTASPTCNSSVACRTSRSGRSYPATGSPLHSRPRSSAARTCATTTSTASRSTSQTSSVLTPSAGNACGSACRRRSVSRIPPGRQRAACHRTVSHDLEYARHGRGGLRYPVPETSTVVLITRRRPLNGRAARGLRVRRSRHSP